METLLVIIGGAMALGGAFWSGWIGHDMRHPLLTVDIPEIPEPRLQKAALQAQHPAGGVGRGSVGTGGEPVD